MRLMGFVHGCEWHCSGRHLVWVFVQKIQEVAKAVCSSEWQRRGPATQFSRKSAEEILTGIVSVFPGFFF